jgi:branched-chain amino acid transport system ATP-binding protein
VSAVLILDDLWVSLGGIEIVRGATWAVPSGIHGLIGPNGAGKSTLINAIAGAVPLARGRVTLGGVPLSGLRADQIARRGVSRTFQVPQAVRGVTCVDFVGLCGAPRAAVLDALARVGLRTRALAPTMSVSLPELRRLEFARALVMRPRVLILDEVMAGLSDTEQEALCDVVAEIATPDLIIVMVEHVMTAVRRLCASTTVLADGQVLLSGPTEQVLHDPRTIEIYLGAQLAA